jgi:hypothetical protein
MLSRRLEMSHFVFSLMQFFGCEQVQAGLDEFEELLLREITSWRHLVSLHEKLINALYARFVTFSEFMNWI